ncbi:MULTISPECIES: hypothetical protein [Serratia]|uniref:hypothetical protein n=1 Tax=Serratia TaxID=613 RepID=UPI000A43B479|nr:hypothetical protein [Serratia sp. 506_PEND]
MYKKSTAMRRAWRDVKEKAGQSAQVFWFACVAGAGLLLGALFIYSLLKVLP